LDLVGIVEEAVISNFGSQPHASPVMPLTQVILSDSSAYQYNTENKVHSSCNVTVYMQVRGTDGN